MREQIHTAQRELIRVMGERKRSEARITELSQQIENWEKRAELAVRHGDDGLAREALAQKQRLLAECEQLNGTRSELQHAAVEMKAEIDRMKRTHQGYSSTHGTLATQVSQARAGGGAEGLGAKPGANNFEAFARFEHAVDMDEAQAAAELELDAELDRTALGNMTQRELDARFKTLEIEAEGGKDADVSEPRPHPQESGGEPASPRIRIKP
jgi:phage shock protein A